MWYIVFGINHNLCQPYEKKSANSFRTNTMAPVKNENNFLIL